MGQPRGSGGPRQIRGDLCYVLGCPICTGEMSPRGRYVAEDFDSYADHFVEEYLGPSGHLDPKTAVRLYDLCQLLYEGGLDFEGAEASWDEWESVLRCFAEGYELEALLAVLDLGVMSSSGEQASGALGPLERQAMADTKGELAGYPLSVASRCVKEFDGGMTALIEDACARYDGAPDQSSDLEKLKKGGGPMPKRRRISSSYSTPTASVGSSSGEASRRAAHRPRWRSGGAVRWSRRPLLALRQHLAGRRHAGARSRLGYLCWR